MLEGNHREPPPGLDCLDLSHPPSYCCCYQESFDMNYPHWGIKYPLAYKIVSRCTNKREVYHPPSYCCYCSLVLNQGFFDMGIGEPNTHWHTSSAATKEVLIWTTQIGEPNTQWQTRLSQRISPLQATAAATATKWKFWYELPQSGNPIQCTLHTGI